MLHSNTPLCYFDIETTGFLNKPDVKFLCGVVMFTITLTDGEKKSDIEHYRHFFNAQEMVYFLLKFDKIVGHNIRSFDIPMLVKLCGENHKNPANKMLQELRKRAVDTLLIARVKFPHIKDIDFAQKKLTGKLIGSHSLKAWGVRLGHYKDEFGEKEDAFEEFTLELLSYCKQDVGVTKSLHDHLESRDPLPQTYQSIENQFQDYIYHQEQTGVLFDQSRARLLEKTLVSQKKDLEDELTQLVPPKIQEEDFLPKVNNKTKGYQKGVPVIKKKIIPFNPNSRTQVINYLIDHKGWNPTVFTDKGNPQLNAAVLENLVEEGLEDAEPLKKYFQINKLLGQLSVGKNALLKCVDIKDSRIYGKVITNGAITGRCTHYGPNLAQIPAPRNFGGKEVRSCFVAPKGYKIVGCDASQIELRMLAHYLWHYDGGEYVRAILKGDIHTYNQQAGFLPTRDHAKTVIYALIYGAGNAKLGKIVHPEYSEEQQIKLGREIRHNLEDGITGLGDLTRIVRNTFEERGYLIGLDGRRLYPRGTHSALNTLLQSAGAVLMKKAACLFFDWLKNLEGDSGIFLALNIHDEVQLYVEDNVLSKPDSIGKFFVECIKNAGVALNLKCPQDGEYKIGNNWAETH